VSTDLPTLAVTGSTGAVGGRVARRLASSDVAQRLLARDTSRVPRLDGSVPVEFTGYGDPDSSRKALEGVTTLFMVSASESEDRLGEHKAFVDAAAEAGVRHIVYTSFHGAAPDSTFTLGRDHFNTEEHIKASGMEWTFLRDNFYLDFLPEMAGEDGVIRGPAGDGLVAAVSRDDVAASAAAVLSEPGAHVGMSYALTGPEALSMATVAETLSVALDKKIRYHEETLEEAYESRKKWPAPDWQYDAWVSTYTAIARGEVAEVTHHVLTLTGRPPLSLAQLLDRD
jgi:NAD(P)H dehydrogenase (quinone)